MVSLWDRAFAGCTSLGSVTVPSGCRELGDYLFEDARMKVESIEGVTSVNVNLVFEPEWTPDMMSDEARLELGMM